VDAAAGLQRPVGLGRVADRDAVLAAVTQHPLDAIAEVGVIDDDLGDAGGGQRCEMVGDQRPPTHLQQRLGHGIGQWPHPFAAAGGQDHRPHRLATSGTRSSGGNPASRSCSAANSG
jgi:hypothetical protein